MTCTGVVQGNVVVLEPGVRLPEGVTVEVRLNENEIERLRDIAGGRVDPLNVEARREAARALKALLSPEELAARVGAARGSLAHLPGGVDEFIRLKQEEIKRENRRWAD